MKKTLLFVAAAAMIGSANAQSINVNGSLETWRTFTAGSGSLEAPASWFGADSLIFGMASLPIGITPQKMLFKETAAADIHGGAAAAKLTSKNQGQIGVVPGILANAKPVLTGLTLADLTFSGGTSITQRVGSVEAWIKYAPSGADNGRIMAQAVRTGAGSGGRDSIIGSADSILAQPISTFTKVGLNLKYNGSTLTPDKLLIIFMASNTAGVDGSTMWVDDVTASVFPAGVNDKAAKAGVKVYPNPAKDFLALENTSGNVFNILIIGMDGKVVLTQQFSSSTSLNISHLSSGIYNYVVTDENNLFVTKDKLVINR
ncbi:MAG: T9SS type A sorting domain-containing protein [Sphingobacteriales bacterium]|nr:MAG: T9SS type A sorting domain-containing protein [Sphingobacteriales bacterium]